MKVFISWSGSRSQAVAELMNDWIKCVLQASNPWISTRGIDKGSIWFSEISDQLKDTAAGIVCLTQENKDKPWILFETGALAKGLNTNRVCTFLIDLEPKDIEDPLAQFNHTTADSDSMWGLISSLNAGLDVNRLSDKVLRQVFDTYWPQFDSGFKQILEDFPVKASVAPRTDKSILSEILNNTRVLSNRIRELESRNEKLDPVLRSKYTNSNMNFPGYVKNVTRWRKDGITESACIQRLAEVGVGEQEIIEIMNSVSIAELL
ncbi:UNVERIFIED_ORG: hypothetical protein OKW15_005616 [Pseudomonas reinekei]|nr:hypothetical protein [Pseudomonas reinekei]